MIRTCTIPECDNVAAWVDRQSVRHEVVSLATGTEYESYQSVKTFAVKFLCEEHCELPE